MSKRKTQREESQVPEAAKPERANVTGLATILFVYLVLACAYNIIIPAGTAVQHNADENAHVLYIQTLAQGHLPVFTANADAYENHQPPLYYLLELPLYAALKSAGNAAAVHGLRLLSTLFGLLLIFVAYKTARELVPDNHIVALSTAAVVAFLPMNLNLNASVNNDSLANLVMGAGIWQCVRILMRSRNEDAAWHTRQALILGAAIGVGTLTKTSTLLLAPAALFVYLKATQRGVMSAGTAGRGIVVALVVGALIGSPWLIRNQILYGDPVAQHVFQTSFGNTAQTPDIIRIVFNGDMGAYFGTVIKWTFASYWGVFDSMTLFLGQNPTLPHQGVFNPLEPIYDIILVVIALSTIGLVRLLLKKPSPFSLESGVALALFITVILMTAVVFLRFILTFFQAQGRYLYPALIPFSILFALGWTGWTSKASLQKSIYAVLICSLVLLNAYALYFQLIPRFVVMQ